MTSCLTPKYNRHNFKDAGRACPVDYRLDQRIWSSEISDDHVFDTLYVAGGLYGNPFAATRLIEMLEAEKSRLGEGGRAGMVFNGDMHWFDRTIEDFRRIEEMASPYITLLGNVEAEVRRRNDVGVGCGCAYPDCTDDASVSRSNRIHNIMKREIRPHEDMLSLLDNRDTHMLARVGECTVGITHGDEKLLGGWDCALEQLEDVLRQAELSDFMDMNGIDIMATTHTCAAVSARLASGIVINNGSCGLPTFKGQNFGIVTRISVLPCDDAVYRAEYKGLYVEAVPVRYDHDAYLEWFDGLWPVNSPAEVSYRDRIINGPNAYIENSILGGFNVMPAFREEARAPRKPADENALRAAMARIMYFEDMVPEESLLRTNDKLKTIQVNVGKRCNLACSHCHVQAGPARTEVIERETLEAVLKAAERFGFETIDVTGGAPEMAPDFEWFITRASEMGFKIIVRTNLTILLERGYEHLIKKYAELGVNVVASLPNFSEAPADGQRGRGVFGKSIEVLRMLNEEGYGNDSDKELDLVFNPQRDTLPPDQSSLEKLYKRELERYRVTFNRLFAVTNNPVGRYGEYLLSCGAYESYMNMLIDSFNPDACVNMMCRSQISVGYDGRIYDCDFNQVMDMPCRGPEGDLTIFDIAEGRVSSLEREIRFDCHCYACTAGAGSSCGGTLVQGEN